MSAEPKGLTVVAPQQSLTAGLTEAEWEKRKEMFRKLIVKDGDPARVDLAMVICRQYGFDPILKHVVLINGSVYVTRDGLLHIAHASGQFDGLEVGLTQLHDGEWAATATVYRKDMTRPIRYTVFEREHTADKVDGRSAWGKYPRAMLAKCAEVAALRRAFDVSLGAVEELGYDGVEPSSSIGQVTVIREVEGGTDQIRVVDAPMVYGGGRPGRAPAQLPGPTPPARVAQAGEPAAGTAEAGEVPQGLGWTPFWAWAKDRGLKTRDDIDRAAGVATIGMVPAEIKAAILARAPGGEKRPLTADETIEWLGAQDRPLALQERACKHLFGLSEERAELEAWYAMAQVLCHQDAVDGAWFDRTTDLGWHTQVVPAVQEEAQEPDGGALQGDVPGDEHPEGVPF